jgi:GT2 family glycosyltransferase
MTPRLGVVVLTHGDGEEALPLLRSLPDEHGVSAEAIVAVQNPVRPEDVTLIPPHDGIGVLRMPDNRGYAGGMNAGMRHHLDDGAELVLILTGEVGLRPGAVERLLAAAAGAPDFGALGPAIWWRSEDRPFSFGGMRLSAGRIDQLHARPEADEQGIAACDWIEGAAMLLRAEALKEVGLLDERFFLYFEETELGLRLSRAGWRLGVVLDAVAEQEPGLARRPGAYAYLLTRNGLEYSRRAAGARGVARVLGERAREGWQAARVLASPRSTPAARAANRLRLAATARGVADFARRRWGAPPQSLRGLGDIAGRDGD